MEIERKFLIKSLPEKLDSYEHHTIVQGYVDNEPVVRIRQYDNKYILTIKSLGLMERIEVEKELTESEFKDLSTMVQGNVISKVRYKIPYGEYTIELDIFKDDFEGLIMAEVEFPDKEKAESFIAPDFMSVDVTDNPKFQNSQMSSMNKKDIHEFITCLC
ncbi:MAG: CYTH domain-containing protein [Eubacterium sp.]|nr:CYTH domain-containing protein [Eubacterium sp.]